MKNVEKFTEDYNRLMFGGDYELIRVKDPTTGVKGHGAEGSFVFFQDVSGKTITQTSKPQKKLRSKIQDQIKPDSDNTSRFKLGGYMRREEAAKYLGISLRTLTNWQQRKVVPVVQVGRRVTLFRPADLDRVLRRFTLKAAGDEV